MKIVDELMQLNKIVNISKCPEGIYPKIKDVYEQLIEPNLPNVDVVQKWHTLLVRYMEDKDAVYILRKYASDKIDGDWATRRGMLTEYLDGSYVGVDNYFAHLIYAMAHTGYIPDYDDFKSSMINRKLPVRFRRKTEIEDIKSAYPSVPYDNVGINNNNWKLSHVISANQDYPTDIKIVLSKNFPNSYNSDWTLDKESFYYARKLNKNMTNQEREALKIHFFRVCDPINHFLSPKIGVHQYPFGKDIGEEKDLILYIKKKFISRYGQPYKEYLRMVKDNTSDIRTLSELENSLINLDTRFHYRNIKSNTSSIIKNKNPNITEDQLYLMILLYVMQGHSFTQIEKFVLGIETQSFGGFIAKKALNNVGVTAADKGTMSSMDELLNASKNTDNAFSRTMKKLLDWIANSDSIDLKKIIKNK